jgi:predicted acetyltransferase
MEEIRLLTEPEITEYVEIAGNAFPMIKINTLREQRNFHRKIVQSIKARVSNGAYGYFKDGELVGGIRLMDFPMNCFGQKILLGGLGLVAVHLAHKKEKVASQMIQYYFNHYDSQDTFLLGLYPFRLDFYKKMGFGFGSKNKQYQISPSQLPASVSKEHIRMLTIHDQQLILDYDGRYMETHHGYIALSAFELQCDFEERKKYVGFEKNGRLEGYMTFNFQPDPDGRYNIHVTRMFYHRREVLAELLTFLHSQADQVARIIIDTHEEYFHFLSNNPANGAHTIFLHHQTNVEEAGIMYRVINNRRLFETLRQHNFGGVTLGLKININDSFYPKNNGTLIIEFKNGTPNLVENGSYLVEITMDIAEFSSMVMGVVPFSQLYQYFKAEISECAYIPTIDQLFYTGEKPVCYTQF